MKKNVLYGFFLITYLLIACTLLSQKIEKEMATQAEIQERFPIGGSTSSMTLDPLFYKDGVGWLYEVTEGTGWSSGLRTTRLPEERWSYEEFGRFLRFVGGREYWFVNTASRHPIHGGMVEIIETFETGADRYLFHCPEGIPEALKLPESWSVTDQSANAILLEVPDGSFPFFQHRAKVLTGIPKLENSRFFSLTEAEQFLEQLPNAALVAAVLVVPVILWLFSAPMLREPGKYTSPLILNIGIAGAALIALGYLLPGIDFPASLLPADTLFSISHYKAEFTVLFDALSGFGETDLWDMAQKVKGDALGIFTTAAAAAMTVIFTEFFLTALISRVVRWNQTRYRGKYVRRKSRPAP